MATPPQRGFPCPYCAAPVEAGQSRCAGCRARLLYGLIAAPQADRRVQERAAAVLAAVPGGPGLAEARRRVREGLPLIVGLSRARTDEVQGQLVDVGLLSRIGPAPRGTAPLEPEPSGAGRAVKLAIAVAALLAFAVFQALRTTPEPAAPVAGAAGEAGAVAATPAPPLDLRGGFERSRHGHLWLVFLAQVRDAGPPPSADLVLRLRDETGTVLWTGSVPPTGAHDREVVAGSETLHQRSLSGRLSLSDVFLQGGEQLSLEGSWHGRDSARTPLEVPGPMRFR